MKKLLRGLLLTAFIFGSYLPAYATPTGIKSYSQTAASNNSTPPGGAPTGWAPNQVGPVVRQIMAELRRWYDDPAWVDHGDTYAYVGGTSFKVAGIDVTALYPVGMRLRAIGSLTGTIYGTITTSSFSTDTTITVTWDSGSLSNETLAIYRGFPTAGSPLTSSMMTFASGFIGTSSIQNSAITNPLLANMNATTVKANITGSSAAPTDVTLATLLATLSTFTGDSGSGGVQGLVPAPSSGDAAAGKFLKASGGWAAPSTFTATAGTTGKIVLGAVTIQWGPCTTSPGGITLTFGTSFSGTPYMVWGSNPISSTIWPSNFWTSTTALGEGGNGAGGSEAGFYMAVGPT